MTKERNTSSRTEKLLIKYNAYDGDNLIAKMHKDCTKEQLDEFTRLYYSKRTYYQHVEKAMRLIKIEIINKRWIELVENFECNDDDYIPVQESEKVIHLWLKDQRIEWESFMENFLLIADKAIMKHNRLALIGESNAGKSLIIRSLTEPLMAVAQLSQGTGYNFIFQEMAVKRGCVWEEPMIAMDQVETFKLLLEGAKTTVHQKCKPDVIIERTPMFFTSNHELWRLCPIEEKPIRNRCTI